MVYTVNDKVSCNFISNTNFTANSYSEENVNNRLLLSNNIMMRWRKSGISNQSKKYKRISQPWKNREKNINKASKDYSY